MGWQVDGKSAISILRMDTAKWNPEPTRNTEFNKVCLKFYLLKELGLHRQNTSLFRKYTLISPIQFFNFTFTTMPCLFFFWDIRQKTVFISQIVHYELVINLLERGFIPVMQLRLAERSQLWRKRGHVSHLIPVNHLITIMLHLKHVQN